MKGNGTCRYMEKGERDLAGEGKRRVPLHWKKEEMG